MIESFSEIFGNSMTIEVILKAIRNGGFPKFSIFAGVMGVGKTSAAHAAAIALTCENNDVVFRGDVTQCNCSSCSNNHLLLPTQGHSQTVSVLNCAEIKTYEDVNNMLKLVFETKKSNTHVFILEEAHTLKNVNNAFTSMLERIDRLPEGVFIIMCTTRKRDILEELRSRAIIFDFKRLNAMDMYKCAIAIAQRYGIHYNSITMNSIIQRSAGIPRDMEKSLRFFKNAGMSDDEVQTYVNPCEVYDIIDLLSSACLQDISSYRFVIDNVLSKSDTYSFINAFKDLLIEYTFVEAGLKSEVLLKQHVDTLKDLLSDVPILDLLQFVDSIPLDISEESLKFKLVKLHFILERYGAVKKSAVFNV